MIGTDKSVQIVRNLLSGKLANSRNFLLKNARDNDGHSAPLLKSAAQSLSQQHAFLMNADSIDSMRGDIEDYPAFLWR